MMKLRDEHLKGKKVNINKQNEIEYWCRLLGCRENDLVHAVLKVGDSAISVEAFLSMNCRSNR
ncbi:MAG: DUF3606 domain-containing protein [Bacteroidetes bacterium]|nr:DUF3606 domain-containing protein [Bacteroidota bacterium]